jgi:hypothetical protein
MCDIGRFITTGLRRSTPAQPMIRGGASLETVAWHDISRAFADRMQKPRTSGTVRFLVSAHASSELFVLKQLVEGLLGATD